MKISRMFIFALTLIIAGSAAAYSASAQVVALGAAGIDDHARVLGVSSNKSCLLEILFSLSPPQLRRH